MQRRISVPTLGTLTTPLAQIKRSRACGPHWWPPEGNVQRSLLMTWRLCAQLSFGDQAGSEAKLGVGIGRSL
jgi:hypothetical protein